MRTIIEEDELKQTVEEVEAAGESIKRASETVGAAAGEKIERKIATMGERVRGMGERAVRERQMELARKVRGFGLAGRDAAEDLAGKAPPPMVAGAEALAQTSDRIADYLETKRVKEMADDAAELTREHPGLVFGGLLLAGFAAGRFLKASEADVPRELS